MICDGVAISFQATQFAGSILSPRSERASSVVRGSHPRKYCKQRRIFLDQLPLVRRQLRELTAGGISDVEWRSLVEGDLVAAVLPLAAFLRELSVCGAICHAQNRVILCKEFNGLADFLRTLATTAATSAYLPLKAVDMVRSAFTECDGVISYADVGHLILWAPVVYAAITGTYRSNVSIDLVRAALLMFAIVDCRCLSAVVQRSLGTLLLRICVSVEELHRAPGLSVLPVDPPEVADSDCVNIGAYFPASGVGHSRTNLLRSIPRYWADSQATDLLRDGTVCQKLGTRHFSLLPGTVMLNMRARAVLTSDSCRLVQFALRTRHMSWV